MASSALDCRSCTWQIGENPRCAQHRRSQVRYRFLDVAFGAFLSACVAWLHHSFVPGGAFSVASFAISMLVLMILQSVLSLLIGDERLKMLSAVGIGTA